MSCPLCDDTGWKTAIDADGIRRVGRCECWRDSLSARLLAEARIPPRYQRCDLGNFLTYPNERLLHALESARRFAKAFPVVDRGLFLIGPPGIGKTHIAVAVLREAVQASGAHGLFYDTRDLLRVIRSTYNPLVRTAEMDILQPVMDADLLVLDDLGAEKTSEWVEETLNLIVNTRYNHRRATILTTNYEDNQDNKDDPTDPNSLLVRIGVRMHSRLHEMCEKLEFDGADYRHLPPNGGAGDLVDLWKRGVGRGVARRTLPARSSSAARAQLRDNRGDLGWTGGKAGN